MQPPNEVGKTAVEELLNEDTPEGYHETLSLFYEAYVGSEQCNGTNGKQRSLVLTHYKSLRRFLYRINKERKEKRLTKRMIWLR